MKKIKFLAMSLLLCASIFGFAACKKDDESSDESLDGTYDVKMWVSEIDGVDTLTQTQVDAFEAANPGIIINSTIEGVSEGESATQMITDVESGADIFCFAQDQISRLVQAGALNALGTAASAEVTANNDPNSVAAATVGEKIYCYPMTADNGYFMYYDKSVISADHIDSLEEIIADCEAAGKNFSFQLEGSAWYNAAFFFATGCKSEWTTLTDGTFTAVDDTFNSAKGLIALEGMQKLLQSTCYSNTAAASDFAAAIPSAVVVSGTWESATAKETLGDNFGVAELPSFTVDGTSYHLGSYSGFKLMGVKPQTDAKRAAVLQKLALFLTNSDNQLERFTEFGWGPSNLVALENEAVKADPILSALNAQNDYAIPQGQIHGSWWDIGKTLATGAKAAATGDATALQAVLDSYSTQINALFSMSTDEKESFTVIGAFDGTNWDTDIKMYQKPEGTWYSEAITFAAGDTFQVRQGKAWDVQFGAVGEDGFSTKDNFTITEAGTYFVKLVYDKEAGTGVVSLVKSNPVIGYSVIGSMNGDTGWTIDYDMEIQEDGSWLSQAITFVDGDEFQVRLGYSWDAQYGAVGEDGFSTSSNFAATAGTYRVKLVFNADGTKATVSLVAAE